MTTVTSLTTHHICFKPSVSASEAHLSLTQSQITLFFWSYDVNFDGLTGVSPAS